MWRIGSAPNNTSKWKMGLNSAFKGLIRHKNVINHIKAQRLTLKSPNYIPSAICWHY